MTPEQIEQLISDLAAKLGPAGQHVYDLAVRQVVIDGIANAIVALIGGAIAIGYARWAIEYGRRTIARRAKTREKCGMCSSSYTCTEHDIEGVVAPLAFGGIIPLIAAVVAAGCALAALSMLLNPEWAAIQKIAGAIR